MKEVSKNRIINIQLNLIKNKFWVSIFLISLILLGIKAIKELSIDAVPDISPVQVLITTRTGGLDPEQVEKTVTYYIESEMTGLPNVKDIRSLSKYGLSQVIVIFKDGTNIYFARQMVIEKLQSVSGSLPNGLVPQIGSNTTGLGEVLMYTLLPKKGSELEKKNEYEQLQYLHTLQTFRVKPFLKSHIQGVVDVDTNGGFKKEIHLALQPRALEKYGINLNDIIERIRTTGENFGGGYIEKNNKQIIVRTNGKIDLDKLSKMPIKLTGTGHKVKIGDVANVSIRASQRLGAASFQGKQAIIGTLMMLNGENSDRINKKALKAINEIELPNDVELKILYQRGILISKTLKVVFTNLLEGVLFVVLILFLILKNTRAALIVSLAIPLSMLTTVLLMNYYNISANLMSLGAIDLGLLADASLVFIENIVSRLEKVKIKNLNSKQKLEIISESAKEVNKPVILGLLIVMLVYIPVLSLEGVEGKMFDPMTKTVLIALGSSLLYAILLLPVLVYLFLFKGNFEHKEGRILKSIENAYLKSLNFALAPKFINKIIILGGIIFFSLISFFIFTKLGSDFVPPLDEGDMVITISHPIDISLTSTIERQLNIEKIIMQYPEVVHTYSRIGTAESASDPMGVNLVDTFIILKDKSSWAKVKIKNQLRKRTKNELFIDIEKKIISLYPTAQALQTQPINMRFNDMLEGSRADISLRIYGKDLEKLILLQNEAKSILSQLKGAREVLLDELTALRLGPVLNIEPNLNELNKYNVHLEDLNNVFKMAMSGEELGSLYDYDLRFTIILKLDDKYRNDFEEIKHIPVPIEHSGNISLGVLANIIEKESVISIARATGRRYAGVGVYLEDDQDSLSFFKMAQEKLTEKLSLPEGYSLSWGGSFKNLEAAKSKFALIIPIILVVMFLLLYQNFNNVKYTLIVFSTIPLAMTGGIWAIYLRDIVFSVSAAIGFITLMGLSVLNAMVVISSINQFKLEKNISLNDAITKGVITRFRTVLMTTLVASFGFLPMAVNTGLGAEVQRPLATVVIGGLFSSIILTLFLVPILYQFAEGKKKKL